MLYNEDRDPDIVHLLEWSAYAIVGGELRAVAEPWTKVDEAGCVKVHKGYHMTTRGRRSKGKKLVRTMAKADLGAAIADALVGDEAHLDELAHLALAEASS